MTRRPATFAVALGLTLGCAAAPVAAQQPAPSAADSACATPEVRAALPLVDAQLAAFRAQHRLPGLSAAIACGDSIIFARGYGYADVEDSVPAGPETVYRVASITKTFTAVMLMQLRDAGKLRLDDPVSAHLPAFHLAHPVPGARPITLRELATHTSGLEREVDIPYWRNDAFPSRDSLIAMLDRARPPLAPLQQVKYSNAGYALLGWALAAAAGEPYVDYVRRHILEPLGLHHSSLVATPQIAARLAVGYVGPTATMPMHRAHQEHFRGLLPAAGMYTTPVDLARYAMLFYQGPLDTTSAVLDGASVHQMELPAWMAPDWSSGRGIGLSLWRTGPDHTLAVGHAGYVGGFRSQLSVVPSARIAVAVMTNTEADPAPAASRTLDVLLPIVARVQARRASREWLTPPASWTKYLGVYRWEPTDESYEVRIVRKQLVLWPTTAEGDDYIVLKPDPRRPNTFIQQGGGNDGEPVVFLTDTAGHITGMTVSGYRYLRVDGR